MKKLLAIFLIALMLIPIGVAMNVSAANVAQGTCGAGLTWTLDDMGTLSVLGTGIMDNYTLWQTPGWYNLRANIKQIIIYDAIVIGVNAFRDTPNVTKVTVLGSNMQIVGNEAFINCPKLDTIYFGPNLVAVGMDAIYNTGYYNNPANWDNGLLYLDGCLFNAKYNQPETVNIKAGTRVIADYAFGYGGNGMVTVNIPDSVTRVGQYSFTSCDTLAHINFGNGLKFIGTYAFEGSAIADVTIPDSVETIESWAFSDTENLTDINIGRGVTSLGGCVFNGSAHYNNRDNWEDGILYAGDYLIADRVGWGQNNFAIKEGTRVLCDDSFVQSSGLYAVDIPDSVCVMGNRSFENVPNLIIRCHSGSFAEAYARMRGLRYEILCRHSFGEYIDDNNATCYDEGTKTATCALCGMKDVITVPALGHNFSEWWVEKFPTYTEEGLMLRRCDRCYLTEEKILGKIAEPPQPPVYEAPYLSSYGVQLTVNNIYNVKDLFIAEGGYSTYRQVKDNLLVSATSAKIKDNKFTYTVKHHNVYTVYIRYNDGTHDILHGEITGVEPMFRINGLQLTIDNLYDVKVIRTAYGSYDKVRDIKNAATHRAFTQKNDVKGQDSYKIQYRDNGPVTVAVVYNDGYEVLYTYDVAKKTPTVEQQGNKVVFGDLNGLYNIRYAKGEYTTSTQIKAAPGSVAIKPAKIDENGNITVKNLTSGTYTFCVQYDDESYNYYIITVS